MVNTTKEMRLFCRVDIEAIVEDLIESGPAEAKDLIERILVSFADEDLNTEVAQLALNIEVIYEPEEEDEEEFDPDPE